MSVSRPSRSGAAAGGSVQLWQLTLVGTHLAAAIVGFGFSRTTAPAAAPVLLSSRCGGVGASARDDDAATRQLASGGGCGGCGSSLIPSVATIKGYASDPAALPSPVHTLPPSLPRAVQALYRGPGGIVSPYTGFDASAWPQDMQGWNGEDNALRDLVAAANATAVIEVGAWKGQSSAFLALAMLENERTRASLAPPPPEPGEYEYVPPPPPEPFLLSVDTWQGAPEFLANRVDFHDEERYLYTAHGWPLVYFQWLANMAHAGLQRVAFPLPAASLIAVEYLRRVDEGFRADVIYVDGSHEEHDVLDDVAAWFPFLREDNPEAVMIGDDYPGWPGVRAAVATLVKTKCLPGTEVHLLEQKWWLYRRECPELAKWIPAQTPPE